MLTALLIACSVGWHGQAKHCHAHSDVPAPNSVGLGHATRPQPASAVVVRAVGIGFPPPRMPGAQGRLMAQRAAEVVAVRNLAVKLGVGPQGRLPSFRYASTKHLLNGSVEVTVETTSPVGRNTTARPRGMSNVEW